MGLPANDPVLELRPENLKSGLFGGKRSLAVSPEYLGLGPVAPRWQVALQERWFPSVRATIWQREKKAET